MSGEEITHVAYKKTMFEENRVSTYKFSKLFDKWLVKINSLYTEASIGRNLIGRNFGALISNLIGQTLSTEQFDWLIKIDDRSKRAIWMAINIVPEDL